MITIRQAELQDCRLINEMAWQVFPATYRNIISEEQCRYMMEWMYALPVLEEQVSTGRHVYLLAFADERPAGYLSIEKQEEDLFHLQKIYVLPDFQGLGIGRQLFDAAVAHIRKVHPTACTMELNVNRDNPAVAFYKRMGMTIARQGDFPIGNGFFMNDYIMALNIDGESAR